MAYRAKTTNFKHVIHIILIASVIILGGNILLSKSKLVEAENILAGKNADKITKDRLNTLYDLSLKAQLSGAKDAVEFYKKHIHKEYEGAMHVEISINNTLAKKETILLTKFEYLRETEEAYKVGKFKELKNGIVSYEIAKDGRSAKVKDRAYLLADIPRKKDGTYKLRQFINCDQLYVLNDKNVMQLKSSTCKVEGRMNKENQASKEN